MAEDLMEKDGVSVKIPLFQDAMTQTKEVITGLRFGATVAINGIPLSPERSLKLRNHSPTGFAWGYGGSGPAQLALAVLLEFTTEENALRLYQDFKFEIIAGLEGSFELPVERVKTWLAGKGVQA
jgi:hypothetical protein